MMYVGLTTDGGMYTSTDFPMDADYPIEPAKIPFLANITRIVAVSGERLAVYTTQVSDQKPDRCEFFFQFFGRREMLARFAESLAKYKSIAAFAGRSFVVPTLIYSYIGLLGEVPTILRQASSQKTWEEFPLVDVGNKIGFGGATRTLPLAVYARAMGSPVDHSLGELSCAIEAVEFTKNLNEWFDGGWGR